MDVLFFLVPLSLLLASGGLFACIWAIRSGQYDDTSSPPEALIFEDAESNLPPKETSQK